jgi:outer membrane protein
MNKIWINAFAGILLTLFPCTIEAKQWTLKDCINYAIENTTSRFKKIDCQSKVPWRMCYSLRRHCCPSLEASTSQNVTYRPWPETGSATVANGYVQSSVDKTYYNGSYGVNADTLF